jgi:hypothetical protein
MNLSYGSVEMPTKTLAPGDDLVVHYGDVRPIPDPTHLTTQQLLRENNWLREVIEARLNGMDNGLKLLQANADKSPTIAELDARVVEKFEGINVRFLERDERIKQSNMESKEAIAAALQAAKEAVGEQNKSRDQAITKQEAATTKQMDQINTLINTMDKSVDFRLGDVKDRVTKIEGNKQGAVETRHETGSVWGYIFGAAGLLVGVLSMIAAFALVFKH